MQKKAGCCSDASTVLLLTELEFTGYGLPNSRFWNEIHFQNTQNVDSTRKADVVRRHLKDGLPVSQLASELDVQPGQIHQWIATALTQLEGTFEVGGKNPWRATEGLETRQARKFDQQLP